MKIGKTLWKPFSVTESFHDPEFLNYRWGIHAKEIILNIYQRLWYNYSLQC